MFARGQYEVCRGEGRIEFLPRWIFCRGQLLGPFSSDEGDRPPLFPRGGSAAVWQRVEALVACSTGSYTDMCACMRAHLPHMLTLAMALCIQSSCTPIVGFHVVFQSKPTIKDMT